MMRGQNLLWGYCFLFFLPTAALHAEEPLPPDLVPHSSKLKPVVWEVYLKSKSVRLRRVAAIRLAEEGQTEYAAIPALIKALKDEDVHVQTSVAIALAGMGPKAKESLPAMSEVLKSPNRELRARVAESMVRIGPEGKHAPLFLKALKDDEKKVRLWAAVGLLILKDRSPDYPPHLVSALTSDDDDYRNECSHALRFAGLAAAPLLEQLLKDKQASVRKRAAWGFVTIASRYDPLPASAIRALEGTLRDDDRNVVRSSILALAKLGGAAKSSVPLVAECLKHPDPEVRYSAADDLPTFGKAALAAVPSLVDALDDEDEDVRKQAARSLKELWALVEARIKAAENPKGISDKKSPGRK
jgi:HEAT repeat protein